eukprot:g624.t1
MHYSECIEIFAEILARDEDIGTSTAVTKKPSVDAYFDEQKFRERLFYETATTKSGDRGEETEDPPLALVISCAHNSISGLYIDAAMKASKQGVLQGDLVDKAVEHALAATKIWKENAMAHINLANVHRGRGNIEKALEHFQFVVSIEPSSRRWRRSQEASSNASVDGNKDTWFYRWVVEPRLSCFSVARYMEALLLSQLGRHKEAIEPLRSFRFRYRIASSVWTTAANGPGRLHASQTSTTSSLASHFAKAVPLSLSKALRCAFAPDSEYWEKTQYSDRGYFSFWYDTRKPPSNAVEFLIKTRLLPLTGRTDIIGCEWWAHTRVAGRNLGHQLHFDTEESMVEKHGTISHPVVSSVTYLSGQGFGGPTLVFDQRVDDRAGATRGALVWPLDDSFMTFPGDRLHGVLPARASQSPPPSSSSSAAVRPKKRAKTTSETHTATQRLTLMVGFWNVDVVRLGGRRRRLGPCSPFPRETRRSTWPALFAIPKGCSEGDSNDFSRGACDDLRAKRVPVCEIHDPLWEAIPVDGGQDDERGRPKRDGEKKDGDMSLVPPGDIDQRFFVHDMRDFRGHLLEKSGRVGPYTKSRLVITTDTTNADKEMPGFLIPIEEISIEYYMLGPDLLRVPRMTVN